MNFCEWGTRFTQVEPMSASCTIGENHVPASVRQVSRSTLALDVRTSHLQDGLLDRLNTPVSLTIENALIEGTLEWYTIEGASYLIGITVSPKLLPVWKKLLAGRGRAVMQTSTRPVSI